MTTTLADELKEREASSFVGREKERERFSAFLAPTEPTRFLAVLGPGGAGKSALIRRFLRHVEESRIPALLLDGQQIEPSAASFLSGLREVTGLPTDAAVFERLQGESPGVFFLDTFERLEPLGPWLRDQFFPRLGSTMRVVLSARELDPFLWLADPAWRQLCTQMPLAPFHRKESERFLALNDVRRERWDEAMDLSHGNPLVLSLIAELLVRHPEADLRAGLPTDLMHRLMAHLLTTPPDEEHLAALQLACLLRSTSEESLQLILQPGRPEELFRWLAGLSFMRVGKSGVVPHDLIRDVVVRDFRARRPARSEDMLRTAAQHLIDRLLSPSAGDRQRPMDELFFLVRDAPAMQKLFGGHHGDGLYVDEATDEERREILETIGHHGGARAEEVARHWLSQPATSLSVTRDAAGSWKGFVLFVVLEERPALPAGGDPVLGSMWTYVEDHGGLRQGEVALLGRFWMTREGRQEVGPIQTKLFQFITEKQIVTPGLTFLACCFESPEKWMPAGGPFQVRLMAKAETAKGTYGWLGYNWRELSLRKWMASWTRDVFGTTTGAPPHGPTEPVLALQRVEFDTAVKAALRAWFEPDRLLQNPLVRSRLVLDRSEARAPISERVGALRALLLKTVEQLPGATFDDRHRRVLEATYFRPATKQTAIAEDLQLPFSTYRYHLGRASTRLCDVLWQLELGHTTPDEPLAKI